MTEINGTWQVVDRPRNKKVIGVKWVYRTKFNPNNSVNKLRVYLIASMEYI